MFSVAWIKVTEYRAGGKPLNSSHQRHCPPIELEEEEDKEEKEEGAEEEEEMTVFTLISLCKKQS